MTIPAATLPQNVGSGYVAAAYIVFFAIVLIYVVIMALRLSRVERDLRKLHSRARESHADEASRARESHADEPPSPGAPPAAPTERARERETV